jgi:hypothetical protein
MLLHCISACFIQIDMIPVDDAELKTLLFSIIELCLSLLFTHITYHQRVWQQDKPNVESALSDIMIEITRTVYPRLKPSGMITAGDLDFIKCMFENIKGRPGRK